MAENEGKKVGHSWSLPTLLLQGAGKGIELSLISRRKLTLEQPQPQAISETLRESQ
jgi:hypothetical protein